MSVAGVLLAAGASTRMRGVDKLLQPVRQVPLLQDRAKLFENARLEPLIVVVPQSHGARKAVLSGTSCQIVENGAAATGMASSIKSAVEVLRGTSCQAALIMPADMPDITLEDLQTLLQAHAADPTRITRASTEDGLPGSPVLFPRAYFSQLLALSGDESGRSVIKAHASEVSLVALPNTNATQDLDTPEAWAAWRAVNPSL